MGAIELRERWRDARGQSIPPGHYTLRYAVQPWFKEHLGTSEYRDFLLLLRTSDDPGDTMAVAQAIEVSGLVTDSGHPAVMALQPLESSGESTPEGSDGVGIVRIHGPGLDLALRTHPLPWADHPP